jgi:alpha-galactosidase
MLVVGLPNRASDPSIDSAIANLIIGSDLSRIDELGMELLTSKDALAVADFAVKFLMQPRNPGTGDEDSKQLQAWISGPSSCNRAVVV